MIGEVYYVNYNFKIEQARNGKIAVYSGPNNVMLTLSQLTGMGIDVCQLDDFDLESYQKAYRLDDTASAGIPLLGRKRRHLICELLEEYQAEPCTSLRDANIRMLKEMDDELLKDWISYEYRPPQRFIGSISITHGNADKITFTTGSGEHLWEVAHHPKLREFIMHGWDIGRHHRYDWDIDTDLVASVKGTTLEKLEWLVPWNEDAPMVWKLENAKTLFCGCEVHREERIYQFIQANVHMDNGPRYRFSEFFLTLRRYPPEQIIKELHDCGTSIQSFHIGNDQIDWYRVASAIAQKEMTDPKHEERHDLTYDEVRQKIERYTKLDLSACTPADRLQEDV